MVPLECLQRGGRSREGLQRIGRRARHALHRVERRGGTGQHAGNVAARATLIQTALVLEMTRLVTPPRHRTAERVAVGVVGTGLAKLLLAYSNGQNISPTWAIIELIGPLLLTPTSLRTVVTGSAAARHGPPASRRSMATATNTGRRTVARTSPVRTSARSSFRRLAQSGNVW